MKHNYDGKNGITINHICISHIKKTTNENGQSSIDCGGIWQKTEAGNYASKIPNKVSNEIIAVYHNYEGDFTKPFSYSIGCKVHLPQKFQKAWTA